MLKKIGVDQLVEGMYIHELCASWVEVPFWSTRFLVDSSSLLSKVQRSGVRELYIDTSKGKDVLEVPVPPTAATSATPTPETAVSTPESRSNAEEFGQAAKILAQSREAVSLMFSEARMGRVTEIEKAGALVDQIAASVIRNQHALVALSRLKNADDYTYMHSVAVCAMMIALARQLQLSDDEVRVCGKAGLLHDIGKMAVPIEILNKPGPLTDSEFEQVRRHPQAGYELMLRVPGLPAIAMDVCLHHHEKFDGTGYPNGLRGTGISLYARMGAICDVYDAITSNRPYKAGWCPAESLRRMAEWTKQGQFDPTLFAAFVKCVGIYPVGTLLKLKSGRLAVVMDVSKSLLRPVVKVLYSSKSMAYLPPELIDLSVQPQEEVVSREEASKWGLTDLEKFWMQG